MSVSNTVIFTPDEIARARILWKGVTASVFHSQAKETIVAPAMRRIDEQTKQENDAAYMTYLLETLIVRGA